MQGKNKSTWIYALIQGIVVGLAGMVHGIFAALQGNIPTGGYLLPLGIFTLIHNYLITGIAAIVVALAVILWTIGFIHTKNGPSVFLALSILLFLVGGGVAQTVFIILTWAVSTQIDKPLTWWEKRIHDKIKNCLAKAWLAILISDYSVILIAIGIWLVLSQPSISYRTPTIVEYTLWSFLVIGVLLQPLVIVSGFAHDIERQSTLSE